MNCFTIAATSILAGFAIIAPATALTSELWAGASLHDESGIFNVIANFIVPTIKGAGDGSGSIWISLDGDDDCAGSFQTGIDWTKISDSVAYNPWYKWGSQRYTFKQNIDIAAGNEIRASLNYSVGSESERVALAEITNLAGHLDSISEEAPINFGSQLCGKSAHWLIGNFTSPGLDPYAAIGTFKFTSASASATSSPSPAPPAPFASASASAYASASAQENTILGVEGAEAVNLRREEVLTNVIFTDDHTISIESTGR